MTRILIIGGGPAGAAAGITAKRLGIDTLLIEQGNRNRDKICGDCLIQDSQEALKKLGVLDKVRERGMFLQEAMVYGMRGEKIPLSSPVYTLQRTVLDQILRDEYEKDGDILYNTHIDKISSDTDIVKVIDRSGKEYKGDVAILATGASVNLAKQLGFEYETAPAAAIRGYMRNNGVDKMFFWFDKSVFPGYGWAFPVPGNLLNVGVGYFQIRRPKKKLPELLDDLVSGDAGKIVGKEWVSKPESWPLRTGLKRDAVKDRVLLVGENAHTTYDFSGEGIGKAMFSGIIAAETISTAKSFSSEGLSNYEDLLSGFSIVYESYKKVMKAFLNPITNYVLTKLIEHSREGRRLIERSLREESLPEDIASIKKALGIDNKITKFLYTRFLTH